MESSLLYESDHRDLFITVPFIIGVVDSQMQLISEGAVVTVKRVDIGELVELESV